MSTIDIRNGKQCEITEIIFWDHDIAKTTPATHLKVDNDHEVAIHDEEDFVFIVSQEHAENLIKSLQKAIELGWFNKS